METLLLLWILFVCPRIVNISVRAVSILEKDLLIALEPFTRIFVKYDSGNREYKLHLKEVKRKMDKRIKPSTHAGWWSVIAMLIASILIIVVIIAMNMPYNLSFPAPRMGALIVALAAALFACAGTVCGAIALLQKDRGTLVFVSEALGILFFSAVFIALAFPGLLLGE
jgi:archaellum biogenesis protein FlaJ (TadC family)